MSRLSGYQKQLLFFLSVATFFEGYDFTALSQILPNLRAELYLDEMAGGLLGSAISLGTVAAYFLVRLSDRWGRRPVLLLSVLGYASFSFLSGLAVGPYQFALLQFTARMFQVAQWGVGFIYAAEEFPAVRRGFVIGFVQASNSLGVIACAAIVPTLLESPYGWRMVYFVGVLPLAILPYAWRRLRETHRFETHRAELRSTRTQWFAILRGPYRKRVLQLGLIWSLTYLSTNTALLFWKEFAVGERGFTDAQVGHAVVIASVLAIPFVFPIGRLLDVWGRRRSAVVIYGTSALFVYLAYRLYDFWLLTACLAVAIVGGVALLALLNALTTELFPTDVRGDAFAWSNTLLGRIGYFIAPAAVGAAASQVGWSTAVPLTAVSVLAALGLILWLIPETAGKELEEAAVL